MIRLTLEETLEACKELRIRYENGGSWVNRTIPPIFGKLIDKYYPHLRDDLMWFSVLEMAVNTAAVYYLVETRGNIMDNDNVIITIADKDKDYHRSISFKRLIEIVKIEDVAERNKRVFNDSQPHPITDSDDVDFSIVISPDYTGESWDELLTDLEEYTGNVINVPWQ